MYMYVCTHGQSTAGFLPLRVTGVAGNNHVQSLMMVVMVTVMMMMMMLLLLFVVL